MAIALGMIYLIEILVQSLWSQDQFGLFGMVPLHLLFRGSEILVLLYFLLSGVIWATGAVRQNPR